MADPNTDEFHTQRLTRPAAAAEIRERTFPVAVRGYDRDAVDQFVQEMAALVSELESMQSREAVIQRALDEVGEETAGILQRAHETADEIAARSRAQAEGRIQRAEREADIARREADQYAQQVIVDTRLLWEERQRLIEDIRQLADEVLATADDAAERIKLPEGLRVAEPAPAEPPTTEVELDVLPGGAAEGPEPAHPGPEAPRPGPQTPAGGATAGVPAPPDTAGEPTIGDAGRRTPE